MSGKGSKPRPIQVDRETYESNWDRIFGKRDLKFTSAGEYMAEQEAPLDSRPDTDSQQPDH